jgi:predicted permease
MFSARLFQSLLWCFPAPFRHEYGAEMVRAFSQELRAADGRSAAAAVWLRSIFDVLTTAPQEHYHVIKQDVRYALRMLAAQPGFTAVAVLSLALGIGANVALFSLIDSVLLRTLPVRDPEQLVMLTDPDSRGHRNGSQTDERSLLTYQEFEQLRDQTGVFANLMAVQSFLERIQVRINGSEPEEIRGQLASAEYFTTLGVPALMGRSFGSADGAKAYVAVISHAFWQRRLAGRADAIGTRLALRRGTFTVIGIMPPEFFGETVGQRPDVWFPMDLQPVVLPGRDWLHDDPASLAKDIWLHAIGRLKPGVTMAQAQAATSTVFQRGLEAYYASAPTEQARRRFLNQQVRLRPAGAGASSVRRSFGQPLTILLAAAGLVLLIACANLGNLMLARATARTRETAVRLALGAGRGDLIRQMLTESMLIALAGGFAGVAAAWLMRAGLLALVSSTIHLPLNAEPSVLAFAFGLTMVAGLLLAVLPALRMMKVEASAGIKEQGRGMTGSAAWLRAGKVVVAGQVALSLPLLIGAGLLVRTFQNLQRVDLGFSRERLLLVNVDVETAGYEEPKRQALFERLHARVAAVPGVRKSTYSRHAPFMGGDAGDEVLVEGYTRKGDDDRGSAYDHIGPNYFSTYGIPVLMGREITDRDHASAPRVCVINEAFAKTFFAGRNPIGMHVTQIFGPQRNTFEVVGVVANSKKRSLREAGHRYFVPAAQPIDVPNSIVISVRTAGEPQAAVAGIRRAIAAEDPNLPVTEAKSMQELVDSRTQVDGLLAQLSIAFGVVALLLAAIGLYGVLSYGVARRTSEIGIRKALGAGEGAVIGMILRETTWLMAGGVVAGVGLAYGSLRLIQSRLFGLEPADPVAIGLGVAALGVVALIAAWLPARRAARVDPMVAIRYE